MAVLFPNARSETEFTLRLPMNKMLKRCPLSRAEAPVPGKLAQDSVSVTSLGNVSQKRMSRRGT